MVWPKVFPPTSGSLVKPGSGLTRPSRVTDMGHVHMWPRSSSISGASQVFQFACAMQHKHQRLVATGRRALAMPYNIRKLWMHADQEAPR